MSLEQVTGVLLILVPVAFNLCFFILSRLFDYPDILRSPAASILARFQAGGVRLKLVWYAFMLTAVLLAPVVVLVGQVLARDGSSVVPTAVAFGILAAAVQFLGLARWPFVVPALARTHADPASGEATQEAALVVFDALNRYLGVAVGECLGYLFTGVWTVLVGVAMTQSSLVAAWLAWPGIVIGLALVAGSLEFVGRFEEKGWRLAGAIVPIAYVAWSLWLVAAGVVLLVG